MSTGIVGLYLEGGRARVPYRYCRAVCRARVPTGIVGLYLEGDRARVPYRYCRAIFRGGQG